MYTDKVSICIMYTIGMARQSQTLGSWHGHRQHYCESQDTIRHNDRATNWILCNLLPGTDRVLFSSPEHLDWLLRLFRPLFNGVQVQILQQALIPTPRPSDGQLWTSKILWNGLQRFMWISWTYMKLEYSTEFLFIF